MNYCKIGFLTGIGGNRTGIGDYFRRLDAAGRPAVAISYDDAGPVLELQQLRKRSGVPHILAYRPTVYDAPAGQNPDYNKTPAEASNEYYEHWRQRIPAELDPALVQFIAFNEGRKSAHWGEFWGNVGYHFALRAIADGYRIALFGWSAGTPEPAAYNTNGWRRLLGLIDNFHDRIAIAVHEGANPADPAAAAGDIPLINDIGWITGRYRHLWDAADAAGLRRPRILITECAWKYNRAAPLGVGMQHVRQAAQFYGAEKYVEAVALWYLGGGGQHGNVADTLQPYIKPITELALSNAFGGIDPDPPIPRNPNIIMHPKTVPADIGQHNPYRHALALAIYADGGRAASEEWSGDGAGRGAANWVYQLAIMPDDSRRIYGVNHDDYDNVIIVYPDPKV